MTVDIADALLNDVDNASTVTFTFSEATTNFDNDDVLLLGGTLSTITGSGTSYSATFTAFGPLSGFGSVSVIDGSYTDAAGNSGAGGFDTVPIDTARPSVTITDDEAGTATIAGGSILYTFQFGSTVTGFDAADITVVNGTKGTFTAVDGDTYTLVVLPAAGIQGNLTVDVAAGVAFDPANNPNTAAVQSVQAVNTRASIVLDETGGVQSAAADPDAPTDLTVENDVANRPAIFGQWEILNGLDTTRYAQNLIGGADGTGTTTLALTASGGGSFNGAATNLFDNVTGNRIFLYTDGPSGIVVGRVGTGTGTGDAASGGAIAFALAVENNGTLSLAEYRSIEHPDNLSNDKSVDLLSDTLVSLVYVTATTGGATFSAALAMSIDDDGPQAESEAPRIVTESSAVTNDWLPSAITVAESDTAFVPITTIIGMAPGDTLAIDFAVAESSGRTITWRLWDTENSTAVQLGTPNTSGTFGTITAAVTVAGTYQLQVNYNDTETPVTQEALITNVTLTHSVIGTVIGAVTANDTFGVDGSVGVVGINFINELNQAEFAEVPAAGVVNVDTLLGSLTINALGQYTYTADTDAISGSGFDTDTITYTRKDGDGDTSSADVVFHIVDVALPGTLDATILTNTSGQAQSVYLTFVDVLQPQFSYAGLYDLDGQASTFHRQVGWNIDAFQEYAVSLESTGDLVPLTGLTVEGITIHGQEGNEGIVGLELDNTNPTILDQTALTAIIRPDDPTPLSPLQAETASFDGDGIGKRLV